MKLSRKWRWVIGGMVSLAALFVAFMFAMAFLNPFHRHEHCIKQTGLGFRLYANDHHGEYPFHTNGFGDALLLLVERSRSAAGRVGSGGRPGGLRGGMGFHWHRRFQASRWGRNDERVCPSLRPSQT